MHGVIPGKNLQYPIFRGIRGESFQEPLGIHWTENQTVAAFFASGGGTHEKAIIIHAIAKPEDIMERHEVQDKDVYSEQHWEKEVPIREGATILVTAITRGKKIIDEDGKERWSSCTLKYKTPKEMKV